MLMESSSELSELAPGLLFKKTIKSEAAVESSDATLNVLLLGHKVLIYYTTLPCFAFLHWFHLEIR